MFPYLRLGPFLLQMPLLALFIGFWIGNTFVEREAVRLGLNKEKINNLIGYGLFGGIFGARLVYAAQARRCNSNWPICRTKWALHLLL